MYMKWWADNFKQTLKFFAFSIFKVLAHEQILTQVRDSFMILGPEFVTDIV